jgi:hypothetical protein
MAVNLIVLAVTVLVAGFVAIWIAVPRVRPWMEMPKHRFLERQRGFPEVIRSGERDNAGGISVDLVAIPLTSSDNL